jgi:hypothetical protein
LLILLKKHFGKEVLPQAEPWLNVFQELYRCLKEQLEIESPSVKDLISFFKSATNIFKIIFDHQAGYVLYRKGGEMIIEKAEVVVSTPSLDL